MPFTDPTLIAAIDAACSSANPFERAAGHNFRWDERLGPERVKAFEQPRFLPSTSDFSHLAEAYQAYFVERLQWDGRGPVGDAFLPVNDGAVLAALPDEGRRLVRLVKIDSILCKIPDLTFEKLKSAVDIFNATTVNDGALPLQWAESVLRVFADAWNAYDQRPPAFVGYELDVKNDLAADDWAERLRRRLGLGHLHVAAGGKPIPVMLLSYTVADLLHAAARHGVREDAIRVPTVLESRCYAYFFPSPTPLPYGRTVDLGGGQRTDNLTCELVHLPVDLQIDHIKKIAMIGTSIFDPTKEDLDHHLIRVRDDHLASLRFDTELEHKSKRDDFGEPMS